VGRGYLDDPEKTAAAFVPDPFSLEPGGRMYLTGDVGRWTAAGLLDFLGRKGTQVKVRGHRVELGEIEAAVARHPAVRQVAVLVRPDERGQERLVAYVVGDVRLERSELHTFLADRLPNYMEPESVVQLAAMPLNRNGKIDRHALPDPPPLGGSRADAARPQTELETAIARVWEEVLRVDRVGIHDNFFDLGGHSLHAIRIVANLKGKLGLEIPIRQLFLTPTVAQLADLATDPETSGPAPIPRLADRPHYPLSLGQEVQWFAYQMSLGKEGWWRPCGVLRMKGNLDRHALRLALQALVDRHEALRTSFVDVDGEPVQVIHDAAEVVCSETDLSAFDPIERPRRFGELLEEEMATPIDYSAPSLLRCHLVGLEGEHRLLIQLPHIVSDGWTTGVLVSELARLYNAIRGGRPVSLPPLPVRYVDFAAWQKERLRTPGLLAERDFWLAHFKNDVPRLGLPVERGHRGELENRALLVTSTIGRELVDRLRHTAASHGTTLFVALLAACQVLLARVCDQTDLIIGTPVAGRNHPDLDRVIGPFINPLALRTSLSGNPSFVELLGRARQTVLEALAHQEYPFESWLQELRHACGRLDLKLYTVLFFVQEKLVAPSFDGLETIVEPPLGRSDVESHSPRLLEGQPLSFEAVETGEGWRLITIGDSSLFAHAALDRLLGQWQRILEQVSQNPDLRLDQIDLVDAGEKALLDRFGRETAFQSDPALQRSVRAACESGATVAFCDDGTELSWAAAKPLGGPELLRIIRERRVRALATSPAAIGRLDRALSRGLAFAELPLANVVCILRRWEDARVPGLCDGRPVSTVYVFDETTSAALWITDRAACSSSRVAGVPVGSHVIRVLDACRQPVAIDVDGDIYIQDRQSPPCFAGHRGRWRHDGQLEIEVCDGHSAAARVDRDHCPYRAPRRPGERTLAAAWQEVLGPDEIGTEDDFVALGGGPEEALQISERLGDANLLVWPEQILHARTIARLAPIVDDNMSLRDAEQKSAPLTPLQQALLTLARDGSAPPTGFVVLRSRISPEPAVVSAALREIVNAHEALRLRVEQSGRLGRQPSDETGEAVLTTLDLSSLDPERRIRAWTTAIAIERERVDGTRASLRAVLARWPGEGDTLALIASAYVVDEWSWPSLIHDLGVACRRIACGGSALQESRPSYSAWLFAAERIAAFAEPAAVRIERERGVLWAARAGADEASATIAGTSHRALQAVPSAMIRRLFETIFVRVIGARIVEYEHDRRGNASGFPNLSNTIGQFGALTPLVQRTSNVSGPMVRFRFVPASRPVEPSDPPLFELQEFEPSPLVLLKEDDRPDIRVIAWDVGDALHLKVICHPAVATGIAASQTLARLRVELEREVEGASRQLDRTFEVASAEVDIEDLFSEAER
jgi:acyl carrier protein